MTIDVAGFEQTAAPPAVPLAAAKSPAVVAIGLLTGTHVELGLEGTEMVLLILTLTLSILTFGATRTNMLQGAVHLVVFFVYFVLIFDP